MIYLVIQSNRKFLAGLEKLVLQDVPHFPVCKNPCILKAPTILLQNSVKNLLHCRTYQYKRPPISNAKWNGQKGVS